MTQSNSPAIPSLSHVLATISQPPAGRHSGPAMSIQSLVSTVQSNQSHEKDREHQSHELGADTFSMCSQTPSIHQIAPVVLPGYQEVNMTTSARSSRKLSTTASTILSERPGTGVHQATPAISPSDTPVLEQQPARYILVPNSNGFPSQQTQHFSANGPAMAQVNSWGSHGIPAAFSAAAENMRRASNGGLNHVDIVRNGGFPSDSMALYPVPGYSYISTLPSSVNGNTATFFPGAPLFASPSEAPRCLPDLPADLAGPSYPFEETPGNSKCGQYPLLDNSWNGVNGDDDLKKKNTLPPPNGRTMASHKHKSSSNGSNTNNNTNNGDSSSSHTTTLVNPVSQETESGTRNHHKSHPQKEFESQTTQSSQRYAATQMNQTHRHHVSHPHATNGQAAHHMTRIAPAILPHPSGHFPLAINPVHIGNSQSGPVHIQSRAPSADREAQHQKIGNTLNGVAEEFPHVKKKKKHSTKDPNAPKHPMSPFLFFLSEVRPKYTAKYPGSKVGPISKMISQEWKNLTPDQKRIYEKRALEDKVRYAKEMEVYLSKKHGPPIHGLNIIQQQPKKQNQRQPQTDSNDD